jgi:hypothetical protein
MATKTRTTHDGRKTSVYVNQENFLAYLSKANVKSESTFLTLSVFDEDTNDQTKITLNGKQVASLRKILA